MLVQYVLDVDFSWLLWIVNILFFSLRRFSLGCPFWVLDVVVFDLEMLNLGLSITHPNWPNQLNLCNVSIDSESLVMETNKISSVFGLAGWETEEPNSANDPSFLCSSLLSAINSVLGAFLSFYKFLGILVIL